MIKITDKRDCCGCAACVQCCPKRCISLKEDEEGFLYPDVNIEECIDCHLCEKVCPWIDRPDKQQPLDALAVKNRNDGERMASSSGGVFILLAKKVIERGGVVFGAVFDDNWEVVHTYAETIDGVKPMMGSKYVQSRIGNCYREAEKFLKSGRDVLFTGVPCQITGLHKFLRKEYPNLLSVDCLCHGVPSPGIWRRYLHEAVGGADYKDQITGIEFRNKYLGGWKNYSFLITGKAVSNDENKVLYSEAHDKNAYMRGFLSDIYLRPSCYSCKCKNGASHSDLTLADFWGIDVISPDVYDDKGVSLIIVSSEKGKSLLYSLDVDVYESSLVVAKTMNGGFKEKTIPHPKRKKFFEQFDKCGSVIKLIEDSSKPTFKIRLRNKINYFNQKMIKFKR
ncbi:Coenzyme F420 hydrogenase/dehydrogenase, beta subunit C-terminal domain [Barnesiella viscericola]|uniref:Coenzyme F420 hydrogenase/dehydrogenase, beta subunit C-terminal domain n=1 Tax=Barnesiella viscericola TaxID=397865 RepID=UPI0023529520|nr:Coenzyme F420 hydrogenase/dehydrogenase, beta subunit C-terminal domain [Barnesiella viscericola]